MLIMTLKSIVFPFSTSQVLAYSSKCRALFQGILCHCSALRRSFHAGFDDTSINVRRTHGKYSQQIKCVYIGPKSRLGQQCKQMYVLQNNRCQSMLYCSYQFGANTWSIGIICKNSYTYVRLDPVWGEVGLDVRIKHHLFMPQLVSFAPYLARWQPSICMGPQYVRWVGGILT